nr:hypothetical protein GCM10020092_073890 [Actinoplanes digitatis]
MIGDLVPDLAPGRVVVDVVAGGHPGDRVLAVADGEGVADQSAVRTGVPPDDLKTGEVDPVGPDTAARRVR